MLRRLCAELLDWTNHLWTLARLTVLDWLTGPPPEISIDRAVREESERLRQAFPEIDFDHPKPARRSSPPEMAEPG
jgi:hypothetical protein